MKKEIKKNNKKSKSPWPTKKAMEQVYKMKLWGTNNTFFYSGEGSHHPQIVNPYIKTVTAFLKAFKNPLIVCDFGCGDFNVGKNLVKHTQKYIAVDIVPELIQYNKETYIAPNLEFHCLDLATELLPPGDCVILRQVLQHLSNTEVQNILNKLSNYKYIILTEHLPHGDFIPNKDIISGQGTRLKKQSGLNLLAPPFNFEIKEEQHLLSVASKEFQGLIDTVLYTTF